MNLAHTAACPSLLEIETHSSDHAMWITLCGAADVSNHEKVEDVLSAVELAGVNRVNLRLSDLTSCDVRTLCRLLNFALEARESHCDVAVVDANPLIELMTRLLEVDEELRYESARTTEN